MNPWVKRKWVKALRSGKYGKGEDQLGSPDRGQYCCLGVLACEMVPEFANADGLTIRVSDNEVLLPDDLAIMYGLDFAAQNNLSRINDYSYDNFDAVIKYIEENL
jgi:hypothetical protein